MENMPRREALKLIAAASAVAATGCREPVREGPPGGRGPEVLPGSPPGSPPGSEGAEVGGRPLAPEAGNAGAAVGTAVVGGMAAAGDAVKSVRSLDFVWWTLDPFLFCVHHDDAYPAGNERFGPAASLAGRRMGQDFAGIDGWRMYHGEVVPGFPQHPHRGFETVTVVRRGLLDHADSLGAAARYGRGDVQWLTAGRGILHAEMFPLLDRSGPNPVELFQIWLNLPSVDKLVEPRFSMLWAPSIPHRRFVDAGGRGTVVTVIAGRLPETPLPPAPPPDSWAAKPESQVAIWAIKLEPGATWTLPAAEAGLSRVLYFFKGAELRLDGRGVARSHGAELHSERSVRIENGAEEAELLLLQGRPIGEPVVQHGPFVMNTREEIQQTIQDYRRTQFGGWPWPAPDPVHGPKPERFARHVDGRMETPG